jgi:nitrite reductase/ring-hydroxylating ferredoxin subunit
MAATLARNADGTVQLELDGQVCRIAGECPHRKGRMEYAYLNERTMRITCPLHRSTFDLKTGRVLSGPACSDLKLIHRDGQ